MIFLLHGWPGSDGNWPGPGRAGACADSLAARGEMPEAVLVFPNGAGSGWLGRSYWLDDWSGRMPVESWLVHDVVPWIDRTYRTHAAPEARAVIGLSDGGTAAFHLALRHPDVFGAAGSHSGTFRLTRCFGDGGLVGPDSSAGRFLDRNSPATIARDRAGVARGLVLYFDCGTDDESIADNRAFARELDSLRVPHEYREYPGTHDWSYWRRHLAGSLVAVTRRMPR